MAAVEEMTTVLEPSPLSDFVETKYVKDVTNRPFLILRPVSRSILEVLQAQERPLWLCM